MSISKTETRFRHAHVPENALAKSILFDAEMMHVHLTDGRIVSVPIKWFPLLQDATAQQRRRYEIGGGGRSLHWPDIDEDLSVANLLAGADSDSA